MIIITRDWHNRPLVAAVPCGPWIPIPSIPIKKKCVPSLRSLHSLSSLINLNSSWRSSLKLQFRLFDIARIDLKLQKIRLKTLKNMKCKSPALNNDATGQHTGRINKSLQISILGIE
jgi:hypothetical protein